MVDYPIKFEPILKEKIWGGEKLGTLLNKNSTAKNIGESWEISGIPGNISVVENGPLKGKSLTELLSTYKGELIGKSIYKQFGNDFPLLIKFIDAKTDLSVQLHPNDQLARERHNSFGKTEMWVVMQADKGARLNIGFQKTLDKQEYINALEEGKLVSLLNFAEVQPGDAFFIHTGKVHAIGGGTLLAEIQQTSDVTYRIYDWDRTDDQGNSRELHTGLALDAIDFEKKDDYKLEYEKPVNKSSNIASCPYFTTNYLKVEGLLEKDYSSLDSFVIYMCTQGTCKITLNSSTEVLSKGETLLIPANTKNLSVQSEQAELLEIYISN